MVQVQVHGLPLDLLARSRQHHDGLTRELLLLALELADRGNVNRLPVRLVELTRQLRSTYSLFTTEQDQQIEDALATGRASIDLVFTVPEDIGPAIAGFAELLDEADEFCRTGGHLLTVVTPPDLLAYRRWLLSQFVVQAQGGPPVPWPAP